MVQESVLRFYMAHLEQRFSPQKLRSTICQFRCLRNSYDLQADHIHHCISYAPQYLYTAKINRPADLPLVMPRQARTPGVCWCRTGVVGAWTVTGGSGCYRRETYGPYWPDGSPPRLPRPLTLTRTPSHENSSYYRNIFCGMW